MARPPRTLSREQERELLEKLIDGSIDLDAPGPYVVTYFDADEGEQVIAEATSLTEAVRALARHMALDGATEGQTAEVTTSGPLSRLEFELMSDIFESSCDVVIALDDVSYLGEITDERPDLDLVIGWEAASPNHDMAFGIYRASARHESAEVAPPAGTSPPATTDVAFTVFTKSTGKKWLN